MGRLDKKAKCMIIFEHKWTWNKFVIDFNENYKQNELYAVMRTKMKLKPELINVLDKNGKLA
jgi:predicted metal-dependent TIM-barrel fold hydrolase